MELLIDCDPGIDDAIAIAYLAGEQQVGRVSLTAVTTVRGNLDASTSGRNAAFVLDRLGLQHVPVLRGAADPLTPLATQVDAEAFHGPDGLGGCHDHAHPDRSESDTPLAVLRALLRAVETGHTLLATGPLTNVALALRAAPELASSPNRIVVMGGAFGSPGGNITPTAEYNFHLDGLAAAEVATSGAPITLIPLDVTERVLISHADLAGLPESPVGRLVRRLLEASIHIHQREMGISGCIMHDALAAAVSVDPTLVGCTPGYLHVVPDGDDRGRCELAPDTEGPVDVALDVDVERARSVILESLSRL